MKNQILAKRYAKALFEFALENKAEEQVLTDLRLLAKVLDENKELRLLLLNPVIPALRKQRIFDQIFQKQINPITHTFLNILIRKGRGHEVVGIATQYHKYYLESRNQVEVELSTAQAVDKELQQRILDLIHGLTEKEILVNNVIDPQLIGGFKVRLGDYLLDASVRKTLERMQAEFEKNLYIYK
ncbi:MAG: ATP synthase F1 subunit delta [Bacteroidales bacterium]|nr:ATP synthase F1 subunit delta [Bacteroidales bacterium]